MVRSSEACVWDMDSCDVRAPEDEVVKAQVSITWVPCVLVIFRVRPVGRGMARPWRAGMRVGGMVAWWGLRSIEEDEVFSGGKEGRSVFLRTEDGIGLMKKALEFMSVTIHRDKEKVSEISDNICKTADGSKSGGAIAGQYFVFAAASALLINSGFREKIIIHLRVNSNEKFFLSSSLAGEERFIAVIQM